MNDSDYDKVFNLMPEYEQKWLLSKQFHIWNAWKGMKCYIYKLRFSIYGRSLLSIDICEVDILYIHIGDSMIYSLK